MNDSKKLNKLKEKEFKFNDIVNDNIINLIIIKKNLILNLKQKIIKFIKIFFYR